jgi:hypothetical protein
MNDGPKVLVVLLLLVSAIGAARISPLAALLLGGGTLAGIACLARHRHGG